MKLDPMEAVNRMPDLGDKTEGKEDGSGLEKEPWQEEIETENAVIESFFKTKGLPIDQEFEGEVEDPTMETGTYHGDSWNYYMNLAVSSGIKKNEQSFNILKEESRDRLAVDLGCGGNYMDAISVVRQLGCKAYFGVDKFNVGKPYGKGGDPENKTYHRKIYNIAYEEGSGNRVSAVVMRGEMLAGLKLLKDNSAVILFNGIEDELFTFMPAEKRISYFSEVANEIRRVVGKDGYIVSTEPHMLVRWGSLKLARDEEFHKACNPYSIMGHPELYRITE